MRILLVSSAFLQPLGGAEHYALTLGRELASRGHSVMFASAWWDPSVRHELELERLEVFTLRTWRPYPPHQGGRLLLKPLFHLLDLLDFRTLRQLDALAESQGVDAVWIHRWQGLGVWVLRARNVTHTVHDFALIDTKTTTMRNGALAKKLPWPQRMRSIVTRTAGHPAKYIYPTPRTRQIHLDHGMKNGSRYASVVPHGWPQGDHNEVPQGSEEVSFLFLGKLTEEKGIRLLLDAWGGGIQGARLAIAGAGALAPIVRDTAHKDHFVFHGWASTALVSRLLDETHVLVFPSLWPENFPIVVTQALLAGRPVLATHIAQPPLVEHDVSGLLVGESPERLRAGLEALAHDHVLRQRLTRGARAAAKSLDIDSHISQLLRIFGEDR